MRLDEIEDRFGDAVELTWRSFLLRPFPEERTLDRFRRYTESWRRPAAMEPQATFRVWEGDADPPSHSVPSAVAGKLAEGFGDDASRRYHRALLAAYFTENRTISDPDVLAAVAEETGLAGDEFRAGYDERFEELREDVFADHAAAAEAGIAAVPTVVVDGQFPIPGAQDLDLYERIVTRRRGLDDRGFDDNGLNDKALDDQG